LENLHYEASMVETDKVEGRIEERLKNTKGMKDLNIDIDSIIKITGLTREEIEKL
jgi:predicted transposase YdaD